MDNILSIVNLLNLFLFGCKVIDLVNKLLLSFSNGSLGKYNAF